MITFRKGLRGLLRGPFCVWKEKEMAEKAALDNARAILATAFRDLGIASTTMKASLDDRGAEIPDEWWQPLDDIAANIDRIRDRLVAPQMRKIDKQIGGLP
jgi:hypothetical protein